MAETRKTPRGRSAGAKAKPVVRETRDYTVIKYNGIEVHVPKVESAAPKKRAAAKKRAAPKKRAAQKKRRSPQEP
jgi:hypothetical protein